MKAALRAKDARRLGAIRLLLAAVKQKEIDERIEIDDAQVLGIIEKLVKQRRDSIEQFQRADRQDLVAQETFELDVLATYRPAQANPAEVATAVAKAIDEANAVGPSDMGKVMALLKSRLAGRADLAAISGQVRARLGTLGGPPAAS